MQAIADRQQGPGLEQLGGVTGHPQYLRRPWVPFFAVLDGIGFCLGSAVPEEDGQLFTEMATTLEILTEIHTAPKIHYVP